MVVCKETMKGTKCDNILYKVISELFLYVKSKNSVSWLDKEQEDNCKEKCLKWLLIGFQIIWP